MRRDTMRWRVLRLIGEYPNEPYLFTVEEIHRYLNDAYQEMARETRALEIRTTILADENTYEYTLPDNVGRPFRVAYDGYFLFPETVQRLDYLDATWTERTGTPERWMRDRLSERTIRIWPAPTVAQSTVEGGGFIYDAEVGELIAVENDDEAEFYNEVGITIQIVSSTDGEEAMDSEYGVLIASNEAGETTFINIEIWATKIPTPLDDDTAEPEFPEWAHQGLVFRAAEMALRANKESMNPELASAYGQLARDYYADLAVLSQNKQPARPKVVGRPAAYRPRYLRRETHITTS